MTRDTCIEMMFGWQANPHFGPFHVLSFIFIGGGFCPDRRGLARALRRPAASALWRRQDLTAMSAIPNMTASF